METVILSQQDVVYGSNNYLKKIFSVDQRAKDCGEISDIWYDCDYIKTKTGEGRGQIEFVDIKLKSKRYVILRNMDEGELEKREYDALIHFFSKDFNKHFVQNHRTWQDWEKESCGIAYRGGSGYCYALWSYIH